MRVPIRKGDPRLDKKIDPAMTEVKYHELQKKLDFWKRVKRPEEAEEVKRLALMGDFSENVGYQVAKGRLRGLNQRILDLENLLGNHLFSNLSSILYPKPLGDFGANYRSKGGGLPLGYLS